MKIKYSHALFRKKKLIQCEIETYSYLSKRFWWKPRNKIWPKVSLEVRKDMGNSNLSNQQKFQGTVSIINLLILVDLVQIGLRCLPSMCVLFEKTNVIDSMQLIHNKEVLCQRARLVHYQQSSCNPLTLSGRANMFG